MSVRAQRPTVVFGAIGRAIAIKDVGEVLEVGEAPRYLHIISINAGVWCVCGHMGKLDEAVSREDMTTW